VNLQTPTHFACFGTSIYRAVNSRNSFIHQTKIGQFPQSEKRETNSLLYIIMGRHISDTRTIMLGNILYTSAIWSFVYSGEILRTNILIQIQIQNYWE